MLLLISILLLALALGCKYVGRIRNPIDRALLPNSFKEYQFLSKNKVNSSDYVIKKIIDGELSDRNSVLFNTLTQEFILKIEEVDSKKNDQGWMTLWKINEEGKIIDSLTAKGLLNTIGVYFEADFYIDWINSGNKSKQKYKQIINFDSITTSDFNGFVKKAEAIAYSDNYKSETINCYLKIEDDWVVFESAEGYKNGYYSNPEVFFKHKTKSVSLLLVIKDSIEPFHKWSDINSFIYLQKFIKESYQRAPFSVNGMGRSGWNGVGYFQLIHNSSFLYFKSYTFFNTDIHHYNPDISIYKPLKNYGDYSSGIDIAFMVIRVRFNKRNPNEGGVYMIGRKDKAGN